MSKNISNPVLTNAIGIEPQSFLPNTANRLALLLYITF